MKALRTLGIRLGKKDLPQGRVGRKVMVLVESTEHGNVLLGMLPGWEMLDDAPVDYAEGYAPDDDDDDDAVPPAGWIVTLVYAALRGVNAGILIRATGGSGKLRIPGFPPQEGITAGIPLVIDVSDDFDDKARTDTKARIQDYLNQGWRLSTPPH